jgi:hypothetical protein
MNENITMMLSEIILRTVGEQMKRKVKGGKFDPGILYANVEITRSNLEAYFKW